MKQRRITERLNAAAAAGETIPDVYGYALMRAIGNLSIGADTDPTMTRAAWCNSSSQAYAPVDLRSARQPS
jgi:hypothetical protein